MARTRAVWVVWLLVGCQGTLTVGEPTPDEEDVVEGTDVSDPQDTDSADVDGEDEPPIDGEDTPDDTPDDTLFDGAYLVVDEPLPAEIYTDELPLSAVVYGADGEALAVDDITWTIAGEADPFFEGAMGETSLEYGVYQVVARADLPNGDRLAYTVGGVRIQHPLAGVYVGELLLTATAEVQGQSLSSDCVGSLDFAVDIEGEALFGDGGCTLAIPLVGSFDLSYGVNGDIDDLEVSGELAVDAVFTTVPVGWSGDITEQGELSGVFGGSLPLFNVEGQLGGRRVTRYVDPSL